ncbi:MAG: acyl-CoA desaturase [Chitinophagaceae bacterium]|nr:MAG: acyl-CoA desaturase [Chitinophagaceae bacterium]
MTLVHVVAFGALFLFSWENLAIALFGLFVLAPLGINVGYHRLLTHRAFVAPRWVMRSLATLGAVIGAGPPLHWVAMHRVHHRYSDTELDPHNATRGFWYSHMFHLFFQDPHEAGEADYIRKYAPDLNADPYLRWLNKSWLVLALLTLPALYLVGGLGFMLWGGFVRIVLTWHVMWFVNSASHRWGYRNYETKDLTVNCWWVGILAAGEGWHNNHHANPSCAAHGHRWWEFDLSYMIIRGMEVFGLARNVKRPPSVKEMRVETVVS